MTTAMSSFPTNDVIDAIFLSYSICTIPAQNPFFETKESTFVEYKEFMYVNEEFHSRTIYERITDVRRYVVRFNEFDIMYLLA